MPAATRKLALGRATAMRKRRVFVVYKHPLFNELVSNLFGASEEVEIVGRSDNVRDAAREIVETKAEAVLVEGNPADGSDLALLNYLLMKANAGAWVEMVVVSVEGRSFATFYRGNIKHLDAKRLLSLVLAG